ncbi:MAG TPA: hypothetical protein VFS52_11065 [Steroidobacteraceae bacterium]|jgi:Mn-containing catalase|nr:hypothetical protein [Steroidobacteraceae bacterium]
MFFQHEALQYTVFGKALYSIQPNFPPGKLPGKKEPVNKYCNVSQGDGDAQGTWNGENIEPSNEREGGIRSRQDDN